jgi:hypothetical protein
MTRAVDTVGKREHRGLLQHGDNRLKRTKYLWLYSEENVGESRRPFFEQVQASDLKTGRAWAIKENLRNLWSYTTPGWAKRFLDRWRSWTARSRLAPVVAVARMISRKLDNVISPPVPERRHRNPLTGTEPGHGQARLLKSPQPLLPFRKLSLISLPRHGPTPLKRDEKAQPARLSGPSRLVVVGAHVRPSISAGATNKA